VQLDGSAVSQQPSSMPAGMGHVWGTLCNGTLGEVVRLCLGLAIFRDPAVLYLLGLLIMSWIEGTDAHSVLDEQA
jgi:hypothetical protein